MARGGRKTETVILTQGREKTRVRREGNEEGGGKE